MKPGIFFLFLCSGLVWSHDVHHAKATQAVSEQELQFYENRIKKDPGDTLSLGRLGNLYLKRARATGNHYHYEQAEDIFERLLVLDPLSDGGAYGAGYALMGRHRFREALELARQVAERHPDVVAYQTLVGDLHLALGHYLEASMFYNTLVVQQRNLGSLSRVAQIKQVRGSHKDALGLLEEAYALALENDAPAGRLAWCKTMIAEAHERLGQLSEARTAYLAALELDKTTDFAAWQLAQLDLVDGHFSKAHSWVHRAIHLSEKPQYLFTQAAIYKAQGNTSQAMRVTRKARALIQAEISDGDMGHIRLLVENLLESKEQLPLALGLAQRDLDEVRTDSEAHELVGWALFLNGKTQEAVPHFDRALGPGSGTARLVLRAGIVNAQAGRNIKARLLINLAGSLPERVDPELRAQAQAALKDLPRPGSFTAQATTHNP